MPTCDTKAVEVNCRDSVVKLSSTSSKAIETDPWCHSALILPKSDQGPVLSNLMMDTAATIGKKTAHA